MPEHTGQDRHAVPESLRLEQLEFPRFKVYAQVHSFHIRMCQEQLASACGGGPGWALAPHPPAPQQPGQLQRLPVQLELDELPKAAAVVVPQGARVPCRPQLLFSPHGLRWPQAYQGHVAMLKSPIGPSTGFRVTGDTARDWALGL